MRLPFWLRRSKTPTTTDIQHDVCSRFGAKCHPVALGSKVGIALQTRGIQPLNGLRHPPEGGTCGWYLWWGDTLTKDVEFFQALHVEHLPDHCPDVMPYLSLPPGWRIQLAPGYEDVWFDESLLRV